MDGIEGIEIEVGTFEFNGYRVIGPREYEYFWAYTGPGWPSMQERIENGDCDE